MIDSGISLSGAVVWTYGCADAESELRDTNHADLPSSVSMFVIIGTRDADMFHRRRRFAEMSTSSSGAESFAGTYPNTKSVSGTFAVNISWAQRLRLAFQALMSS
ncbi:hypothetical protein B0J12DRAFT_694478 [Macrophomina phaseolina]|uniref:Uncharacterized protein n=1 Tax=Macrophomina phaseolina TaxID=35725 RepID=A0ABQ8GSV8_9PEZI|nr:hypothetical protein B0J12DRAFT_694478 [Macrophomina phaseolina]